MIFFKENLHSLPHFMRTHDRLLQSGLLLLLPPTGPPLPEGRFLTGIFFSHIYNSASKKKKKEESLTKQIQILLNKWMLTLALDNTILIVERLGKEKKTGRPNK